MQEMYNRIPNASGIVLTKAVKVNILYYVEGILWQVPLHPSGALHPLLTERSHINASRFIVKERQ